MVMVVRLPSRHTLAPSVIAQSISSRLSGGSTARFAGVNVHKRLVQEESYKENKYDQALKRAFLGTDEDMLAGKPPSLWRLRGVWS